MATNIVREVFDIKTEGGKGRFNILVSMVLGNIVTQLTAGVFYTAFLSYYGMNKAQMGVLTFLPYLASLASLFTPIIMERFPRRKWILVGCRVSYFFINVVGITLLPQLVRGEKGRMTGLIALVFLSNVINMFSNAGFSAWHSHFLPDGIREKFFSIALCIQTTVACSIAMLLSFLGDAVSGSPREMEFLNGIRYFAFAIALLECFVWVRQVERSYPKGEQIKLSKVFTVPVRNKLYMGVVALSAIYNFVDYATKGLFTAYGYQDLEMGYVTFNIVNILYGVSFFLFSGLWRKFIEKYSQLKAFVYILLMFIPAYFAYFLLTPGQDVLFVLLCFVEHFFSVGWSIILSALPYMFLPMKEKTYYFSFYTVVSSLSVFLGILAVTVYSSYMDGRMVSIFGYSLSGMRLLFPIGTVLRIVGVGVMLIIVYRLTPNLPENE